MSEDEARKQIVNHLNQGYLLIVSCRENLPIGYVFERIRVKGVVLQQRHSIIRRATFEEFLSNCNPEEYRTFSRADPSGFFFYEVAVD